MVLHKNAADPQKEVESIISKKIKGATAFEEFFSSYEKIYAKNIAKKGITNISFNLQFLLHSMLQKIWNKACKNVEGWVFFITESNPSKLNLINQLFESAFILNDETA